MTQPDYILYAQHGWADVDRAIGALARRIASPEARVVVPNLGFVNTWVRIAPLIDRVEAIAQQTQREHPNTPIRIIGHSMGGLIWLEVLARHPEWWPLVESFVLVASPVGGADLSRMIDPFGLGIGIARDLGQNRRAIAERIAAEVPTLIIAGDDDWGSDGIVPVECARFNRASYVKVSHVNHAQLKQHPQVAEIIQQFWQSANCLCVPSPVESECDRLIRRLQAIPGMTDTHYRGFENSEPWALLPGGLWLRTWCNRLNVHHVFLSNLAGDCLFAGFVGWPHTIALYQTLWQLRKETAVAVGVREADSKSCYAIRQECIPVMQTIEAHSARRAKLYGRGIWGEGGHHLQKRDALSVNNQIANFRQSLRKIQIKIELDISRF
ncbi:MAG: alpha/beta hydrolase [Phormidesmis sp.]